MSSKCKNFIVHLPVGGKIDDLAAFETSEWGSRLDLNTQSNFRNNPTFRYLKVF